MKISKSRSKISPPPPETEFAFSLVELSIVLVILGLLVGGVVAGQSLIRAAELRSVSTDYQRFLTATLTFRDKYFALPGDFTMASRVWGLLTEGMVSEPIAVSSRLPLPPATAVAII